MSFKCSTHFGEVAGWRCSACRATLCASCTGVRVSGVTRLEICSKCGGLAAPIRVHRGELHPFSVAQLASAWKWPWSKAGALSLFATALLLTIFGFFGAKALAIAAGVTVAYLFQVVRHTAHGGDDFPGPEDFRGYFEDVVGPSLRITVALAWIWVPALVWTLWRGAPAPDPMVEQQRAIEKAMRPGGKGLAIQGMRVVSSPTGIEVADPNAPPPEQPQAEALAAQDAEPETAEAPPARSPLIPALLVLLGVAIAPMSVVASALKTPLRVAANPIVLAGYAVKLGRDYLMLVVFCLLAAGAAFAVSVAGHAVVGAGLASRLPINLAVLFVAFVAFRVIGLLVRARGGDLGYGDEESYLVPVLGDAQPRWVEPPKPATEREPPRAPQAIDLPPEPPATDAAFPQLLARNDAEGMVEILGKSGKDVPHTMMSAASWMGLAQKAWQLKNGWAAAVALKRCLEAEPAGPLAPRAWLLAARVYDEALGDKATSEKLLREVSRRFPDSEPGKFAARRLGG